MTEQNENDARQWESQLLRHAGNVPEIAISLCDAFLQEVPSLLSSVNQKIDTNQMADLYRPLHTLKSCLGYVADPNQMSLATDLEKRVRQDDFVASADFRSRFDQLELIATDWVAEVREFRLRLTGNTSES